MKKITAMLLCLLMLLSCLLVACQPPAGGESSADAGSAPAEQSGNDSSAAISEAESIPGYDSETGKYVASHLPEYTWEEEKEFRVCVYSNNVQTTYFSEEIEPSLYDTTDLALSDAVAERNNVLSERYNKVKIKAVCVDDVKASLALDAAGTTHLYDAALPFMNAAVVMAQNGELYDLNEFSDYIDFDMPWWDQNFLSTMTIKDKTYFAVGDISIMQKIVSGAVIFNKKILEEIDSSIDLYQEVRDGEWTFDRLVELSKKATSDYDGADGMTYKDKWGLSSAYGSLANYYLAAGEHFVTKDSNGNPLLTLGTERSVTVAQKLLNVFAEKDTWVTFCQEFGVGTGGPMWVASLDVFGENRCLFYNSAFSAIKKLRQYTDLEEWGILPCPKFDDIQEEYHTPCAAIWAYGIVIPKAVADPEFSAFMIEAMGSEAKNYITHAYYEVILKTREMKDEDSEEMLDQYIFNNITYDVGLVYNFGGLSTFFDGLIQTRSADVVGKLDGIRDTINLNIADVIERYSD